MPQLPVRYTSSNPPSYISLPKNPSLECDASFTGKHKSFLGGQFLSRHFLKYSLTSPSRQQTGMHATHDGRRSYHYINNHYINNNTEYAYRSLEDGLLLVKRTSPSVAIYNPSTKRILDLPDPNKGVRMMHIFQHSSTGSYYVFCAYRENKEDQFELVDLGGQSNDPCPNINLSWKPVYISEHDQLSRQKKYKFQGIFCNSILYYLVLPRVGLGNPKMICFDLVEQQTCTILDMPDPSLRFDRKDVNFRTWRGKPSICFVLEEKLNVWVLEDYKKHKWADTIQIPWPSLKKYPDWYKVNIPYILCDKDGEDKLIYKKPLKGLRWVYCLKSKKHSRYSNLRPRMVRATLVSIKGMQPEKKNAKLNTAWMYGLLLI